MRCAKDFIHLSTLNPLNEPVMEAFTLTLRRRKLRLREVSKVF